MTLPTDRPSPAAALAPMVLGAAETLFPGYFALVMATGVVSIASEELGFPYAARLLLVINWVAYAALIALLLLRVGRYRRALLADLCDHQRAPGFFTLVAGTCVLGTQTTVIARATGVAELLWYIGAAGWLVVMYAFFTAISVRESKPSLAAGINGAWLIAGVATQSLVVLRSVLDADNAPAPAMQFLCLALFTVGALLYIAIIPLIFYRLTFVPLEARDFTPPYWISMGAVAITTLAGALLIAQAAHWPLLPDYVPFLRGVTLFSWAAATWWIPFLAALTAWRHIVRGDRPRYDPQLWGMVFPLGMYTTGTFHLAHALDLPFLLIGPRVFIFIAAAAWLACFIGLATHLAGAIRGHLRDRDKPRARRVSASPTSHGKATASRTQ